MIKALARLGGVEPGELPKSIAAAGINDKPGIMALFSTHPPIEQRIAALKARASGGSAGNNGAASGSQMGATDGWGRK